jgi:hypothetical protein
MRTIPADRCSAFELGGIPDERQGIVYYEKGSEAYPTTPRASSIPLNCSDEPFSSLVPVLPWTVKKVQRQGELESFCLCTYCSILLTLHRNQGPIRGRDSRHHKVSWASATY